jgi:hypothetical protein
MIYKLNLNLWILWGAVNLKTKPMKILNGVTMNTESIDLGPLTLSIRSARPLN